MNIRNIFIVFSFVFSITHASQEEKQPNIKTCVTPLASFTTTQDFPDFVPLVAVDTPAFKKLVLEAHKQVTRYNFRPAPLTELIEKVKRDEIKIDRYLAYMTDKDLGHRLYPYIMRVGKPIYISRFPAYCANPRYDIRQGSVVLINNGLGLLTFGPESRKYQGEYAVVNTVTLDDFSRTDKRTASEIETAYQAILQPNSLQPKSAL